MWLLYNILLTLLSPIWVPWMLWRTWRRAEKPNWKERSGDYVLPKAEKRRIWVHAVSVGEVVAAMPILRELRVVLPAYEIILSVTTSSGHQTARERAVGLFDHLVYFPIDVPRFQLAAMQRVRPDVIAVMETELWMNFLWAAKVFDARTLLVNGRVSDRSYPRSMKLRFFYRHLLSQVDRCLMQSATDADRIRALGATDVDVLGNCKFDQAIEGLDADPAKWRSTLSLDPAKPVIVVGSTRGETEEQLVLGGLAELGFDRVQVIHAPRHLERVPALEAAVRKATGAVALRSRGETGPYLILDTYGELASVYSVADVVIVGGGFDNLGGQNIIQPLAHGKPVIHGPHMQNFRDVADSAAKAGATVVASNAHELFQCVRKILERDEIRQEMGRAAGSLIRQNLGASRRYADAIADETTRGAKK